MATANLASTKSLTEKFPDFIKKLIQDIQVPDVKFEDIYTREDIELMDLQEKLENKRQLDTSDQRQNLLNQCTNACETLIGFPNTQYILSIYAGLNDIILNGLYDVRHLSLIEKGINDAGTEINEFINAILLQTDIPEDKKLDFTEEESLIIEYQEIYKDYDNLDFYIKNRVDVIIENTKGIEPIYVGVDIATEVKPEEGTQSQGEDENKEEEESNDTKWGGQKSEVRKRRRRSTYRRTQRKNK